MTLQPKAIKEVVRSAQRDWPTLWLLFKLMAQKSALLLSWTLLTLLEMIHGIGINILVEERTFLGGVIGTTHFVEQFVDRKVQEWVDEIRILSKVARSQSHTAFVAFTHSLSTRWNYFL